MKILGFALVAIMGVVCLGFGQYATVNFDLEKNYFNEGQAIPAEKPLMFTGLVPKEVNIINISILSANAKNERDILYTASWKDADNKTNTSFSLAVNYRLRASQKYDFRLDYFNQIDYGQKEQLRKQIEELTHAYLKANLSIVGRQVALEKKEKKILNDLNEIISTVLKDYKSQDDNGFLGLSKIVEQKLEQLNKVSFEKLLKDTTVAEQRDNRSRFLNTQITEVQSVISTEVVQLMDKEWSKLIMSRYVDDFETERKKGSFTINAGYGGVYLGGNLDDLTYGSAPYLGISFPFGNSSLAPNFLRNSSFTMGVFLQNFEDKESNKVSGFLVDRPIYLGLDYKLFEFVRFNAGAAFLEKTEEMTLDGTDILQSNQQILIRPFIGLSARIDLSVGFGR